MTRPRANIPARRLGLLGVLLVVPLVAAAGLVWACVPTARVALDRVSGPGSVQVTMSGSGFPATAQTVDIYLDTKSADHLLKGGVQMSGDGDRSFSTLLAAPDTVGAHLLIPVPRDSNGNDVGTVSSGAGPPAAVYQVTDPSLSVTPGSGRAGTPVTVTGTAFRAGTVKLHWDSAGGSELGSAVATGANFGFAKQVTVPASPAGDHRIVGVPLGDPSDTASATIRVLAPLPPIVPVPDDVGPAIVAAALTSANGTRRVSRRGYVTLFCGAYDEPGVTGRCGARSVKRVKLAGSRRSALLKLGTKGFSAGPGKPARVRFRLGKTAMRMLRKASRVRMRGTVLARDSKGNASPKAAFSFSLKAPRTRRRR